MPTARTDSATRVIHASLTTVYRAFETAGAIERWLPPSNMVGSVLHFDFRSGGSYRMRLAYKDPQDGRGKTADGFDEFTVHLTNIEKERLIEQEIIFDTDDPAFAGTMRMIWTFQASEAGTLVSVSAQDVPIGIRPEDHQTGMKASLENLAAYAERMDREWTDTRASHTPSLPEDTK